eukprot:2669095-Rhodomonas_salina.1
MKRRRQPERSGSHGGSTDPTAAAVSGERNRPQTAAVSSPLLDEGEKAQKSARGGQKSYWWTDGRHVPSTALLS